MPVGANVRGNRKEEWERKNKEEEKEQELEGGREERTE